jgi:carbamoyltransferase
LNCVANGKLVDTGLFKQVFIQPAAGDAGGAPGAALAAYHLYFAKDRTGPQEHTYLGPAFHTLPKGPHRTFTDTSVLLESVAARLQEGKIIGWFQGRMEFGPRALGNPAMQRKLNLSIKYREGFRPFAPACTLERAEYYFGLRAPSPYMLLTRPLNPELCEPLPEGYQGLPMREKLDLVRSRFPSITHVDLSCRVQTVSPETNPLFWRLLKAFEGLTGEAMLINTSFNIRDEPIVCTPQQAYDCFLRTEMDILVVGHTLYQKEDQPTYLHPVKQAPPWNS